MLDDQGGICAICGTDEFPNTPVVDHDHVTNEIRGILCRNCNWGLGQFKDDPDLMLAAAEYIKETKCQTV